MSSKVFEPEIAVKVEHISKRYRFGTLEEKPDSLLGTLTNLATKPIRNFRNIQKLSSFDDDDDSGTVLWAVDDGSFEVKTGEVIGLIGKNGAGKSTLLKILAKITEPTNGKAYINGKVASLLEVGTGFHPELTGRANVNLNGAILGMKNAEIAEKFDEIVKFSGLDSYIDTPVKRYSTGMVVRLAFAVAAHLTPDIMLVDEVLAVGDAEFQQKCLGKMDEFSSSGRTVFFVSHNMASVNRLCSRVILLDKGKIVADGLPGEVTSAYFGGVTGTESSISWKENKAPGSQELKLTSVSLLKDGTAHDGKIATNESFDVRIGYDVLQPELRFRCAIELMTQGVVAFASVEPKETVRYKRGRYYSSLTIPAHLLAEGLHSVRVSIFTSSGMKKHYARVDEAIAFQVVDLMGGDSARGDYAQNLRGIVRPKLDWEMHVGSEHL